jgi:plastocyanin
MPHRRARPASRGAALIAALCAVALMALAGCGSSGPSAGATKPAGASGSASSSEAVITIKDFAFTISTSVSPGAKVTVMNMDGLEHTVTADRGGAFDSPAPAGMSSFTAPTTPGSYPFHCSIHPEMHGTLVVK